MMRLILIAFSILCCLATLVRHSDSEIDPTTAVGVWLFNETAGDTASDSSGNGNDGTLEGDPNWVPDGKFGNALELDGAGDYVSVPDHETLDTELSEDIHNRHLGPRHLQTQRLARVSDKSTGMASRYVLPVATGC